MAEILFDTEITEVVPGTEEFHLSDLWKGDVVSTNSYNLAWKFWILLLNAKNMTSKCNAKTRFGECLMLGANFWNHLQNVCAKP